MFLWFCRIQSWNIVIWRQQHWLWGQWDIMLRDISNICTRRDQTLIICIYFSLTLGLLVWLGGSLTVTVAFRVATAQELSFSMTFPWLSMSIKPLCSGMVEVVPARTSPTLLPHPLALCCNYPVSKCPSASTVVISTVRVKKGSCK